MRRLFNREIFWGSGIYSAVLGDEIDNFEFTITGNVALQVILRSLRKFQQFNDVEDMDWLERSRFLGLFYANLEAFSNKLLEYYLQTMIEIIN